jgi:hypothetical protein
MKKPKKLPRDVNQLAKRIVDISTGQVPAKKQAGIAKKATSARRKK